MLMLVLTRRRGEKLVLPDLGISIEILDTHKNQVRIGIDAPRHITVLREEVHARSKALRPHHAGRQALPPPASHLVAIPRRVLQDQTQAAAVDDPLIVPAMGL
jgi:carbon storage regulator